MKIKEDQLHIKDILKKNLNNLIKLQNQDGNFDTDLFTTLIILESLRHLPSILEKNKIVNRGLSGVKTQQTKKWTWNYWLKSSPQFSKTPYPNDLDDTAGALTILQLYEPSVLNGEAWAYILKTFTEAEVALGGPYQTWIIDHDKNPIWDDIDLVVNTNIAYFFKLLDVELPNIREFVKERLIKGNLYSKYYFSPLSVLYFISRTYNDDEIKKLILIELNKNNSKRFNSSLEIAFYILISLRIGINSKIVEKEVLILEDLAKSGYESAPFYIENVSRDRTSYKGSAALTTAICTEALNEFYIHTQQEHQNIYNNDAQEDMVISRFIKYFHSLPLVKTQIENAISRVRKKDPGKQVTLLPYFFAKSLNAENRKKISKEILIKLGYANLAGWIAYTIYDDFLDNEGNPELLSMANICLRIVSSVYLNEFEDTEIFKEIMNNIDEANAWERKNAYIGTTKNNIKWRILPNYKDYRVLANKSLGHVLGPLCILEACGHSPNSNLSQTVQKFFNHYIIARQLNDDAHDWMDDLKRGFINSASEPLLKEWELTHKKEIDFLSSENELSKIFWHHTILKILDKIDLHLKKANHFLDECEKHGVTKSYLATLLLPLEKASCEARSERQKMIEFLEVYK
jgi:hypothetical protein